MKKLIWYVTAILVFTGTIHAQSPFPHYKTQTPTFTSTPVTPTHTPTPNATRVIPYKSPNVANANNFASPFFLADPISLGTFGLLNPAGFGAYADTSGNTALIMTTAGRVQLRSGINFNEVIFNTDGSTFLTSTNSAPLSIISDPGGMEVEYNGGITFVNENNSAIIFDTNGNIKNPNNTSSATYSVGGIPTPGASGTSASGAPLTVNSGIITGFGPTPTPSIFSGFVTFSNALTTPVTVSITGATATSKVTFGEKGAAVASSFGYTPSTNQVIFNGTFAGAATVAYILIP
jgi:hypothetical protein